MCVYTLLAAIAAFATDSPIFTLTPTLETVAAGLLNLLHVTSSYTAFEQLAGGNAMALFYTYPVWNILGASALFKESLPLASLPWIALALLGAIGLAQPSVTNWTLLGVAAALVAALTETGIYLWFRNSKKEEQPWPKMIQMYGASGLFWAIGAIMMIMLPTGYLASDAFSISPKGLASILTFNTLVGFTGYALRFYLIPKVSTIAFSALSFVGVVAAYLLGWAVTNEIPTAVQAAGAAAIIVANTVLLRREIV
jgi:drug/metabolite transporter (DMT)-like permease